MGLGSQGALAFGDQGRVLYAVNAGSDEISTFLLTPGGARLVQTVDSVAAHPISIAVHGRVVYVLGAGCASGGQDMIAGFIAGPFGVLRPIENSARPLSAANTGPAQVGFDPTGRFLVVTEKMTNRIDTFAVDRAGLAGDAVVHASAGMTPFGFAFDRRGLLIVSEAFGGAPDASAASSYALLRSGDLRTISASVPTTETAACWVATTQDARFAYTTNTGSGSVSGFAVNRRTGTLTLLDADGVTADTGAGSMPIDADTVGDHLLYVLTPGVGQVQGFQIGRDGSLTPVASAGGLPASAAGLLAK
jgi:6-phosphogluconolactonase